MPVFHFNGKISEQSSHNPPNHPPGYCIPARNTAARFIKQPVFIVGIFLKNNLMMAILAKIGKCFVWNLRSIYPGKKKECLKKAIKRSIKC